MPSSPQSWRPLHICWPFVRALLLPGGSTQCQPGCELRLLAAGSRQHLLADRVHVQLLRRLADDLFGGGLDAQHREVVASLLALGSTAVDARWLAITACPALAAC